MYLSLRAPALALLLSGLAVILPFPVKATLLIVNLSLAALVAWDVWRAPGAGSLGCTRELPGVAGIREPLASVLAFRNPLRRTVHLEVRDLAPPSMRPSPPRHRLTIHARAIARCSTSLTPSRRGTFVIGPVVVRTAGPFRLAGRQNTVETREEVKVYPALPGRSEVELRLDQARMLQHGERASPLRGGGTDFDSLREYQTDDDYRRINWRATARSRQAIVNVYREERNQRVLLMIDASRAMAGNVESISRLEHAIDAAHAVAELAARVGDQVGMIAFGEDVRTMLPPRSGRQQSREILDALFDLEATLVAPDYPRAFASVLSRYRRRALIVLLTELVTPSAMEPLFTSVPTLQRRHLLITGSIQDPALTQLGTNRPLSAKGAYEKAAASEALLERDASVRRLRSMGVTVEDRPPGALAGALADRYLTMKSTGQL